MTHERAEKEMDEAIEAIVRRARVFGGEREAA